jgi:hypothetical protein
MTARNWQQHRVVTRGKQDVIVHAAKETDVPED